MGAIVLCLHSCFFRTSFLYFSSAISAYSWQPYARYAARKVKCVVEVEAIKHRKFSYHIRINAIFRRKCKQAV